ncbi:nucleotidyltransferase family protein [Nostoc sp. NIES-2111]
MTIGEERHTDWTGSGIAGGALFHTTEFKLLARCVHWPQGPDDRHQVGKLAAAIKDWQRFLALVRQHRVAGLVNGALTLSGATMPDAHNRELAATARQDGLKELLLLNETLRLTGLLDASGIPVTILKGAELALRIYGRLGIRPSADIDLLVPLEHVEGASQLLASDGYRRVEIADDADPRVLSRHVKIHKDFVFVHPARDTPIELHWRLFQNPYLFPAAASREREALVIGGRTVGVLPRELEFLYLCVHGAEHGWMRLKWLADIGAALRSGWVSAEEIYEAARRLGLTRVVGPGLLLSNRLLETPLPSKLMQDMGSDWRMRRLFMHASDYLVGKEDGVELEDRIEERTRKNLDHYLFSSDVRFLAREFRYDILDRSRGERNLAERTVKLAGRLAALVSRR